MIVSELLVLLILVTSGNATAKSSPKNSVGTYFSAGQFSDCLSTAMAQSYSRREFSDRVQTIHDLRATLASHDLIREGAKCDFYCSDGGVSGISVLRPMNCWLRKKVTGSLILHSGPLVLSHPKFKDLVKPEMSPHQIRDSVVMATREPIRDWLLRQKVNSVSHWQLFEEANRIFGDPFVALGAIGDLFENEREWCDRQSKVKNQCELANRMKAIITPSDDDPIGRNYHFWAHLNMVWNSDGSQEKAASYILEIWKDNDVGDHAANLLGINTSTRAYDLTKMKLAPLGRYMTTNLCTL